MLVFLLLFIKTALAKELYKLVLLEINLYKIAKVSKLSN